MADNVFKIVEVVGTSSKSFSDAVTVAIDKCAATAKGMSWFEVVEHRGSIADSKVREFQVTVKIGCREG
jgi:flavin-binding protein dodecin